MHNTSTRFTTFEFVSLHKIICLVLCITLGATVCIAAPSQTRFKQTNLVSNQAGKASHQDGDLINPWGIAIGNDALFWVADNGSGKSTLYDSNGVKSSLIVSLPNPVSAELSKPTGQVANLVASEFLGDSFIFDTEEGTIVGWNGGFSGVVRANLASTGAVYKGLALARTSQGAFIYAADFHNRKVDVFDANYQPVPSSNANRFVDPGTPAGYAPFNVHLLGSQLYVAYAKQDAEGRDDVTGRGFGFISIYETDGTFVKRFVSGSDAGGRAIQLNAPWGIAQAPRGLGSFSGAILVGNFGDGRIAAFSKPGKFVGFLSNKNNKSIRIPGLWEIIFGTNGVGAPSKLYFSSGPQDETAGLFGYLSVAKVKAVSRSSGGSTGGGSGSKPTPAPTANKTPTPNPTYSYPGSNSGY